MLNNEKKLKIYKLEPNVSIEAMKTLQAEMAGEAEKVGLYSDEDIVDLIMEMRYGRKESLKTIIKK